MSDLYFYRANDELTAALREFGETYNRHVDEVVKPFMAEYPKNPPLINSWQKVIGFDDGAPKEPPPAGLSRSQRRDHLIPVRGKAGDVWREWEAKLALPQTRSAVFRKFGINEQMYAGPGGKTYLGQPNFVDYGEDGVFVYMGCEFDPEPDALVSVRRSVFYALEEKHVDAARERGVL